MISLNSGILLKIVLMFNNLFASCFLINLDFLLPHTTYFDNIIVPPFIAFKTDELVFFVSFPHFTQYDNIIFIHHSMELLSTGVVLNGIALKTKYLPIMEFYSKVF